MTDVEMWATAVAAGRVTNAVLALVALSLVWYRLHRRRWRFHPAEDRFVAGGQMILLAVVIYGSLEQLAQSTQGGARIALTTVALAYIIIGWFMQMRRDVRFRRLEDGGTV